MTNPPPPTIPAAELVRAAEGGPDDMVLVNSDGTLILDPTPDDIATYQLPGQWPRYLCRVAAVSSALARDHDAGVALINRQFARILAMDSLGASAPPPAPVPGRAPVHIGGSSITIDGV